MSDFGKCIQIIYVFFSVSEMLVHERKVYFKIEDVFKNKGLRIVAHRTHAFPNEQDL